MHYDAQEHADSESCFRLEIGPMVVEIEPDLCFDRYATVLTVLTVNYRYDR